MNQSTLYKSWRKSYTANIGDIWDVHRLTERWHIERVDGNPMKPNDISGVLFETGAGAPVIPDIADPYQFPAGGLGTTLLESMLVRSHQWGQPDGKGLEVTINYETRYFEANAAKGMTGNDITAATVLSRGLFLPCEVLPIFMSRNIKIYRDNPGMTQPSNTLDKSLSDIGGSPKEIDVDVKQIGLKLRMVVDANTLPMIGNGTIDGMVDVAYAFLGYKNSQPFLGNIVGSLVCTGANINHLESEFYEFALEFLYDQYYHQSQMPDMASDGRPDRETVSGVTKIKTVYWTRPVRGGVDFNEIWPSGDLGKSQRYQAFAGRWY